MMEKQKTPVPTTFGVAPYLGAEALSCNANGANTTDFVAAGQAAASSATGIGQTIAGASEFTVGSLSIFAKPPSISPSFVRPESAFSPPACQAAGSLSFNGNDNYVVSGTGNAPNNADCSFSFYPDECLGLLSLPYDNQPSGTTVSEFADGASNGFSAITSSGSACTDALTAGAGYETSGVQYGATDANSWIIVTGLFSDSFFALPVGGSSYCAEYEQSPAPGNITNLTTATIVAVNKTAYGYVKVTNPTEADCDIEISMPTTTNTVGANTCTLQLENGIAGSGVPTNPVDADAAGPIPATQLATTACTCNGVTPAVSTESFVTLTSVTCPLTGTTTIPVTCKN
jgi:hypothetical protein